VGRDNLYFAAVVKDDSYVNEANDIDIWQTTTSLSESIMGLEAGIEITPATPRAPGPPAKTASRGFFPRRQSIGGPPSAQGASIAVKKVKGGYV